MQVARALLLAALCCSLACGAAAWRRGPTAAFRLFCNTSAFDGLDQPNWRHRLEREVLPAIRQGYNIDVPPARVPELEAVELGNLSASFAWTRRELKCHLKFYALVCGSLAREQPELLEHRGASWRPAPPRMPRWAPAWASLRELGTEIENNLALMVHLLYHSQPIAALALSQHMAMALGWDWTQGPSAHLTALNDGFASCWDQVALLATMLDADAPNPDTTLAHQLVLGPMHESWYAQLGEFFQGSTEHMTPWRVQGNLHVDLDCPAGAGGTLVQWALPAGVFQQRTSLPSPEDAESFDGPAFTAGGYGWTPYILADSVADVSLGLKLWSAHLPPLEPPSGFHVEFAVVHSEGAHWSTDWLCVWPESFASCSVGSTCAQRNVLPLWQMLSGQRPGFVEHGELLLHIRLNPAAIHPADGAAEGLCSVQLLQPGSLGPQPRLLSGPILNWGYEAAHEGLWDSRGFTSRRLPSASASQIDRRLHSAKEQRFAAAPWVEEAMERLVVQYSEQAVASWLSIGELPAAARALQETAFLAAAVVLTLVCIVVPLAPVVQRAIMQQRARARQIQRMRHLARQAEEEEASSGQAQPLQQAQPQPPRQPLGLDKRQRTAGRKAAQQAQPAQLQQQQTQQLHAPPKTSRMVSSWWGLLAQLLPSRRRLQQQQPEGATPKAVMPPGPKTPPQKQQLRRRVPASPAAAGPQQRGKQRQHAQQPARQQPTKPKGKGSPSRPQSPALAVAARTSSAQQPQGDTAVPSPTLSRAGSVGSSASWQPPSPQLSQAGSGGSSVGRQPPSPLAPTAAASPAEVQGRHSEDAATLLPALAHAFAASEAAAAAVAADAAAGAEGEAVLARVAEAAGAAAAPTPAPAVAGPGVPAEEADPASILLAMLPPEQPPAPGSSSAHGPQPPPEAPAASPAAFASAPAVAAPDEPRESDLCIVCWERRRETVLIPCGHLCLCRRCAEVQMAAAPPLCPVCRTPLERVMHVYAP